MLGSRCDRIDGDSMEEEVWLKSARSCPRIRSSSKMLVEQSASTSKVCANGTSEKAKLRERRGNQTEMVKGYRSVPALSEHMGCS